MGTAFTPGLIVSDHVVIRKTRRLPVRGRVVVEQGAQVTAQTVVARVDLPGTLAVVKAAAQLGCPAERVKQHGLVPDGAAVRKGQVLCERKALFGLMTNRAVSPIDGTVEYISTLSGNIGVRGKPKPLECAAYISGTIVDVLPEEGVVVEAEGALVQGIFGVGGEQHGVIQWVDTGAGALEAAHIAAAMQGAIIVCDARIGAAALQAAATHRLAGLVGASVIDAELMRFLGFDIGVAVTGDENIPFSVMVTEGFGELAMPARTRQLLQTLSGRTAAMNGATQIRAGVIRPELIVPGAQTPQTPRVFSQELRAGTPVRLIRRPHFGARGVVSALPEQAVRIETGSFVRVATITLADGQTVTVPRANLEIVSAV
jgi:hypothetical protein